MKNLKKTENQLVEFAPIYGGVDEEGNAILVRNAVLTEVSEGKAESLKKEEETLTKQNPKRKARVKFLGVAYEATNENGVRVVMTEAEAKKITAAQEQKPAQEQK